MISNTQQLRDFAARVRQAPWIAIDTEADSLHAYPEKLCLLQIAIPDEAVLIDPLADIHLEPLWEAFDHREIILHAADYDLRLLYQGHHFRPASIFDTMWAARLLGETRFGLNDSLTRHLGITLEKGAQKANWGRRPLTPRMIEYALNDVRYLHELEEALRKELIARDRLEWHRQICDHIIQNAASPSNIDRNSVWRIKGHDKLSPLGLAVLRELWHWREKEAVRSNKPPFFILNHEGLSAIAEYVAEKRTLRGYRLPHFLTTRRRYGITEAVGRALEIPETDWPTQIRVRSRRMTRPELDVSDTLRDKRDYQAHQLGLDPTLIASKSTLYALARKECEPAWNALLPWQRGLLESPIQPEAMRAWKKSAAAQIQAQSQSEIDPSTSSADGEVSSDEESLSSE